MKGGIGNLMKQAQQMQADMQKAQEEIANMQIEGQSGGGMVKVTLNGQHECLRIAIDDALLSDDKDMLEDLIAAAINDAAKRVTSASQERLSDVAGGMQLPPGMKMPF